MGAYYKAVLYIDGKLIGFSPWSADNGAKLLEHSYIGNNYAHSVLEMLYKKKAKLGWVCDYNTWGFWDQAEDKKDWNPAYMGDYFV